MVAARGRGVVGWVSHGWRRWKPQIPRIPYLPIRTPYLYPTMMCRSSFGFADFDSCIHISLLKNKFPITSTLVSVSLWHVFSRPPSVRPFVPYCTSETIVYHFQIVHKTSLYLSTIKACFYIAFSFSTSDLVSYLYILACPAFQLLLPFRAANQCSGFSM